MGKADKIYAQILQGNFKNISFSDLQYLLGKLGFTLARTKGSHHIYEHDALEEIVNIQNDKGNAKPYQIRQILQLVEAYGLELK